MMMVETGNEIKMEEMQRVHLESLTKKLEKFTKLFD
jgi:hypothetical protein